MREIALRTAPAWQASWRRLRRGLPAFVKGVLRRQAEAWLPNRETKTYQAWRAARIRARAAVYTDTPPSGLLSVITAVWNGSPVKYLALLAELLITQNPQGTCEWVILDNGCTNKALLAYFKKLEAYSWVRIERSPQNVGITRGLRRCLNAANGRYVLPVDADDYLYPDALRVITRWIQEAGYPALLYTDEDKIAGTKFVQPYLKPDWDPVLLLNSAYIAHLGVIDRVKALELGAYTDEHAEGSPDWDLFVRFMIAGYEGVHIPEILYGWRVHAHSTADDVAAKPYIHTSQRAVLQRFLDARPGQSNFEIEYSPLLPGSAHWRFARTNKGRNEITTVVVKTVSSNDVPASLLPLAEQTAKQDGFIHFISDGLQIDSFDWTTEALGLFELYPDTVMIGGRIRNSKDVITEAGLHFGVGGVCRSPHAGRPAFDPGYFTQIWKQRSVSAVSVQFAVLKAAFLKDLLKQLPAQASLPFLGSWAGAHAIHTGKRVIYSPYLSGISDTPWESLIDSAEVQLFESMNQDIIPDRRYYSRRLSLSKPFALGESQEIAAPDFELSKSGGQPEAGYHKPAAKHAQ